MSGRSMDEVCFESLYKSSPIYLWIEDHAKSGFLSFNEIGVNFMIASMKNAVRQKGAT